MEKTFRFSFETILYIICNLFLLGVAGSLIYCGIVLFIGDIIFRYYVIGIVLLMLIALSFTYINKYNKKYRKEKRKNGR
jgi:hypothetical protein